MRWRLALIALGVVAFACMAAIHRSANAPGTWGDLLAGFAFVGLWIIASELDRARA